MKKSIVVLLTVSLLFLTSCGCNHKWQKATCTTPETCTLCGEMRGDITHSWVTETCVTPKICFICGIENGDALGHTTNDGTCGRCGEEIVKPTWNLEEFVDEFNRGLGEYYLATYESGTFNNQYAINRELDAGIQVIGNTVFIHLLEYGYSSVTSYYDAKEYSISILDTNENEYSLSGYIFPELDGSSIWVKESDVVIDALKKSGDVIFYIEETERPSRNYRFTVQTSNFKELYEQMNGQETTT